MRESYDLTQTVSSGLIWAENTLSTSNALECTLLDSEKTSEGLHEDCVKEREGYFSDSFTFLEYTVRNRCSSEDSCDGSAFDTPRSSFQTSARTSAGHPQVAASRST